MKNFLYNWTAILCLMLTWSVVDANAMSWGISKNGGENGGQIITDYALYLGELQLSSIDQASVYAVHSQGTGSWLGRGWTIPILDSKAFETDEKTVKGVLPSGEIAWATIVKSLESRGIIGGWIAVVNDNQTTLQSGDGTLLNYIDGHLMSMKYANGDAIQIVRSSDGAQISKNGEVLLKLVSHPEMEQVDVGMGGNNFVFTTGGVCPDYKIVNGLPVVTGLEKTISSVTCNDKPILACDIKQKDISGEAKFVMDLTDPYGVSSYELRPVSQLAAKPSSVRSNEFFDSGVLGGRLRKTIYKNPYTGKSTTLKFAYDAASGQLIRCIGDGYLLQRMPDQSYLLKLVVDSLGTIKEVRYSLSKSDRLVIEENNKR